MSPQTKIELDLMSANGCQCPNCQSQTSELYLHARCHRAAGVAVKYTKGSGVINILCYKCGKPIADVKVAES